VIWETIPFIVGHYRTTALAGQNGNAVFAGHVASRNWGNVFINLYEINVGDKIQIYTNDTIFTYTVSKIRLVLPTETSVMDPTQDPTVTLITCGGDWLPDQHDYSRRLIVSAKLTSFKPITPAN
jgi:sortase A